MKNRYDSPEKFREYRQHLQNARLLYTKTFGKPVNITKAVELYYKIHGLPADYFAVTSREQAVISDKKKVWEGDRISEIEKKLECPVCQRCGKTSHLVYSKLPRCLKVNPKRYRSFFECGDDLCTYHFFMLANNELIFRFAIKYGWDWVLSDHGKRVLGFVEGKV